MTFGFPPLRCSFICLSRLRETSERVHFLLSVLARPGHEKTWMRPTKKGPERQSKKGFPTEKLESYFEQDSAPANFFLLRTLQPWLPHFVIESGEYTGSIIRRLFVSYFCFYGPHYVPLVWPFDLWYFQIILFSLFHALHTITNLSE